MEAVLSPVRPTLQRSAVVFDSRWWLQHNEVVRIESTVCEGERNAYPCKPECVRSSERIIVWEAVNRLWWTQPDGLSQGKARKSETSVNREKGFYKDANTLYVPAEPARALIELLHWRLTCTPDARLWENPAWLAKTRPEPACESHAHDQHMRIRAFP